MPIIGLTDNVLPRFQRIGKLRKGGEKTEKGYGPDLDHFRFTSDRAEIVEAFHKVYGKEPRHIRVFIPHRFMQDAFPTWCELWSKSGLQHRCDGRTMMIWRAGNKYERGAKACAGGHQDNDPRNDSIGRLDVVIPELVNAGYVGFVTLETHSINDIAHISGVLKAVEEARDDLRGVEFSLRRVQEKIGVPGFGEREGERSKVDKWLVKIEPAAEWVRVQLESSRARSMMIVTPPSSVDGLTGEVIEVPSSLPALSAIAAPPAKKYLPKTQLKSWKEVKIKTGQWKKAQEGLIREFPAYANDNGKPNSIHILNALAAEGWSEINDNNVGEILPTIRHRVADNASLEL